MSFAVRQAWPSDLPDLVELAVECQADPVRACPYLSARADAITAELTEIDGADDWWSVVWVALDDDREVLGWIAGESDVEMGRIWWFGPFLSNAEMSDPTAAAVPDALLGVASAGMAERGAFPEQELVVDARASAIPAAALRAGFTAEAGSVALRCDVLDADAAAVTELPVEISELADHDDRVVTLHDELFPGTHSPGSFLFSEFYQESGRHDRFVARVDGVTVGYVATEFQQDDSLYIDYLGVDPASRGGGVGTALVATAMRHRAGAATHAHLTVRAANERARRVYARLGFDDDVVLIPYRLGFSLE